LCWNDVEIAMQSSNVVPLGKASWPYLPLPVFDINEPQTTA
jgi:hypothetical protein